MSRFERWAVWSTSLATFLTGVVYLVMKYLLVSDDPFAVVNHPWQPATLKAHILVALGPMIATGYLIQAVTHESLLRAMALSHIGLGLVYGVGLLAHHFSAGGKRAREARSETRRSRRDRRRQARAVRARQETPAA